MFNKFKSIAAAQVEIGDVFIVNDQKWTVRGHASTDQKKFVWLTLADDSSNRILELKFDLYTEITILKRK